MITDYYSILPAFEFIGPHAMRCANSGDRREDGKIRTIIMSDRDVALAVVYVSPDAPGLDVREIVAINRALVQKPS